MQPEIDLFGLPVKTFGLLFALGFVASGALIARRLRELDKPVDWAYEMIFAALVGGLVGSRVYYVVENYDRVKNDLLGGLFGGAGLVWYGGAIGGAIGVIAWAWRRGMLNRGLLDICAAPLALGYAIGRVGCQISGDGDYGKPWNGPWAMAYPHGVVPTDVKVHPTPIYETLTMGLVAFALWQLRDRVRTGALFALYLMGAGLERFLVEFLRRNTVDALGLTTPQLESLAMFAAGGLWLGLMARGDGIRVAGGPGVPARSAARTA
jgi:phosphatidylglycerol:prolipoprotein diacylglycerol transferase